jgi:beta-N-acetylhexosaminidase
VVLGRPNYTSPTQLTGLIGGIRGALTTPPLVVARQAGGESNGFPGLPPRSEPANGATGRPDLVTREAELVARDLRALGVNATLAPLADLADTGGPAVGRAYSADPALVTTLVKAAVVGYRSGGLIAMVGHFPGEGAASQDPTLGAATVGLGLSALEAADMKPFAAVAGLAPVTQLSDALYAAFDGVTPATLLPDAITLLRQRLHFSGVVLSGDLLAVTAATGGSVADAAVRALKAGCDLLFLPGGATDAEAAYNAVLAAIRQGQLDPQAVARSVARVAALKRSYGVK